MGGHGNQPSDLVQQRKTDIMSSSISTYEGDIVAWAQEQAALIRAKRFDLLDLENLAEEIEDVGKSEKRELESRMAVLLAHLLKWQFQPQLQSRSWERTIKEQRIRVELALDETPSLRVSLGDEKWIRGTWANAVSQAIKETGIEAFPEICPWQIENILKNDWLPSKPQ